MGSVILNGLRSLPARAAGFALLASLALSGCADPTATTAPTAVTLSSIVLSSSSVVGGGTVTGTVALTGTAPAGGAAVTLSSNNTAVTPPASVTIPAGSNSTTFAITTTSVAASTTITATYSGASQTATLITTVVAVPALQGLFLSTNVAMAGVPVQGTIVLTAPAPTGGLTVTLSSSTPAATVPATVVVPFGNTTQLFSIDVGAAATTGGATITASYAGAARTAAFTIGQLALSIGLPSIPGGLSDTATISLPIPAPDGGALVTLTSSSPAAIVPAAVLVPAGTTTQTFTIATLNSPPTKTATITASYGGGSQTAAVTVVAYPTVVAVSCSPVTVAAGGTVQCVGTLDGPAPSTSWRLALATSDPSVTAPARVTVAPSSQAFQFTLATSAVSAVTSVTVSVADADSGLALWTVGLSVTPS
jgi:hypothetical protein